MGTLANTRSVTEHMRFDFDFRPAVVGGFVDEKAFDAALDSAIAAHDFGLLQGLVSTYEVLTGERMVNRGV